MSNVPPTTEPTEDAPDPCIVHDYGPTKLGTTRDGLLPCDTTTGEVIDWPPPTTLPLLDDCISSEFNEGGTTRLGLLPCDLPEAAPTATAVQPHPIATELPVTGASEAVMLGVGAGLLALGLTLRRAARLL